MISDDLPELLLHQDTGITGFIGRARCDRDCLRKGVGREPLVVIA